MPEPEWKVENGTVSIIFKRPATTLVGDENDGDGEITDEMELSVRQRNIYILIKADGENTAKTLARMLGLSQRTVEREISFLRHHGFIDKSGSNHGKWITLK